MPLKFCLAGNGCELEKYEINKQVMFNANARMLQVSPLFHLDCFPRPEYLKPAH
jgi:hypothetical protein